VKGCPTASSRPAADSGARFDQGALVLVSASAAFPPRMRRRLPPLLPAWRRRTCAAIQGKQSLVNLFVGFHDIFQHASTPTSAWTARNTH